MLISQSIISTGELKPSIYHVKNEGTVICEVSPSGSTTGSKEAKTIKLVDKGFAKFLSKHTFPCEQTFFDNKIKVYGSDFSVPASLVNLRLLSDGELYNYICKTYSADKAINMPKIILNLINGGKHTGGSTTMCEFMIIPNGSSIADSLTIATRVWSRLGVLLSSKKQDIFVSGREGGYVTKNLTDLQVIFLIDTAINLENVDCSIAIDIAANNFSKKINGKFVYYDNNRKYCTTERVQYYKDLVRKFPRIKYLEDAFNEADMDGWTELMNFFKDTSVLIVADDLTVTNKDYILKYKECFNAVILKVNQVGTFTGLVDAFKSADNCVTIMSQRSGETDSSTIVDCGVGLGVNMMKLGAPARERIVKYNRLLRIEEGLKWKKSKRVLS